MIRTRRLLALLLTLVLVLSLAPAAQAAPPQEACREGGEHIWDVYEDTATCTQGGTRRYRCRKCGIWYNEPSTALGHDWREGEVIEGDGLLTQQRVRELSQMPRLFLLCGHYEGVDERVIGRIADEEISIGDYVLTGGELPALVLTDAIARMCEKAEGCAEEAPVRPAFSKAPVRPAAP